MNSLINYVHHTVYGAHYCAAHTVTTGIYRDMIANINQEANCCFVIKHHKQLLINKGNQKENRHGQSHVYSTGDKLLLKNAWKTMFFQDAYIGPYTVTEVQTV